MNQQGLTLLELIVVLFILAVLGTVTLTQTASLTDETRYQQTVQRLEQLQDAVIGRQPYPNEDPTAVPPGFIADVGRLPLVGEDSNMSELWDINGGDPDNPPEPFALQTLNDLDNELQMAVGWRGPYVRLPIGTNDLVDGWGRAFTLAQNDGSDVDSADDPFATITSDGSGTGDAFDQVRQVVLVDTSSTPVIDRTTGQVTLQLELTLPPGDTDEYAVVRLYGPVNGKVQVVAQSSILQGIADTTQSLSVSFIPADIPIGPKLLRAYQWGDADAPGIEDNLSDRAKSLAKRVTVPAGGVQLPNLVLEGE